MFAPNDPLLDAIAFSRGRFVIEQTGQPPLVLPPHAEIGRVIEDCRGYFAREPNQGERESSITV